MEECKYPFVGLKKVNFFKRAIVNENFSSCRKLTELSMTHEAILASSEQKLKKLVRANYFLFSTKVKNKSER